VNDFAQRGGGRFVHDLGQRRVGVDGRHVLEYYATDQAGNAESVRSTSFQIDMTGPTVAFEASDGKVFSSGNLIVRFQASDPASGVGVADYSVDGSGFTALADNDRQITAAGLGDGPHSIVLRVWDNAGNPTEVALNLSVDHTAASIDLGATIGPLVVTGLTVVGLIGVVLYSRRHA
jgi:hypothetical protein